MLEIPFDVSYHFDENLRDVPNNPAEVRQALTFLQSQLNSDAIEPGGGANRRRWDGDQEARLVALVCCDPPEERARWTLRLLRDQIVELQYVESICHETVRQTLKKRITILTREMLGNSPGAEC